MQQFESGDRLTTDEAREVMLLWEERQRQEVAALPTIKDLAETLRIPTDQAALLLGEVRARHTTPIKKVTNHQAVFFGSLAAIVCGVTLLSAWMISRNTPAAPYERPYPIARANTFAPAPPATEVPIATTAGNQTPAPSESAAETAR